jgi:ribose/xylose/arabinose/galactoside ABC-type transport system permease subunit
MSARSTPGKAPIRQNFALVVVLALALLTNAGLTPGFFTLSVLSSIGIQAVTAGLAVATALGTVSGVLVARYGILPIVVTLALLMIGRGLAQLMVADNPLVVFTNPAFERLGKGYVGPVPVQIVITAAVVVVIGILARVTVFGRYLVAIGGNERAARFTGVPVS